MKKFNLIFLAVLVCFSGFSQKKTSKSEMSSSDVKPIISSSDTLNYSLGVYVGQWIMNNGFSIADISLFNRGIEDILNKRNLAIPDSSVVPIISKYQLSTLIAKNREMESQLFTALKDQKGIGVLPNGVHYMVIKAGGGKRPLADETVIFDAVGVFPDGTLFEDTFQKKQPVTNKVSNLIPGLAEAIQLMPEGATWRIFIPSALGYGSAGVQGVIPGDMALVFDISLLEVKSVK